MCTRRLTTSNTLKVYTGSAWEAGVTAGSGFAPISGANFTGDIDINAKLTVDQDTTGQKHNYSKTIGYVNIVVDISQPVEKILNKISNKNLQLIKNTPGAALGSTRDKPDANYCKEIYHIIYIFLSIN